MDVKQLRYFIAVCRNGSITKAANKAYISYQGLSTSLLRLESELNCRLLERSHDGITLTPEGHYLLARAEKLVDDFDELEQHFKDPKARLTTIKIACALGAVEEYLAPILSDFQTTYPHYRVIVEEAWDTECDRLVEHKKAELGFGIAPIDKALFFCQPIFRSPFCIVVNENSSMADLETISVGALQSCPLIIMNKHSKTNQIFTSVCHALGFRPDIQCYAAEVMAIHRMVVAGVGVGVSVQAVAENLGNPTVVAIPFQEPEMVWEINLFKLKGSELSPGAKALEAYILQRVEADAEPAKI